MDNVTISFKKIKRRNIYITYKNMITHFIHNKYPIIMAANEPMCYLNSYKIDSEFLKYYMIIRKEMFYKILYDFIKNNLGVSKNKYIAIYIDTNMFKNKYPINFNDINSYYNNYILTNLSDIEKQNDSDPIYASFKILIPEMFESEYFYKSIQFFHTIDINNNHHIYFNELHFLNYESNIICQLFKISRKNINEFLVEYNYYINKNTSILFEYRKEKK